MRRTDQNFCGTKGFKQGTFVAIYREAKQNRDEGRETDITTLEQYTAGLALFLV
jgi:hypothetical protein